MPARLFWWDATGVKLKKKVTDGTTITTTEYINGFQYTNGVLDFFPHTSTALGTGSEGYPPKNRRAGVKAVPTGTGAPGGGLTFNSTEEKPTFKVSISTSD